MQMLYLTYIFYVLIPCFQRVFYIFFLNELIMCVNLDTSSVTDCIFSLMYHCLTQPLNCSEREVCKIPEKIPVPPPLPTSSLPSMRNVPPPTPTPPPSPTPPVAVGEPRRTLCPKQAVRVLVTAGVLILLLVIVAVVIAVILGRNTPGINNKGVCVCVCVFVCVCVCVCVCVFFHR